MAWPVTIITLLTINGYIARSLEFPNERYESSLISEGLPLWFDKGQNEFEPERLNSYNGMTDQLREKIERNAELRQLVQLERLWRALDGEAVVYGDSDDNPVQDHFQVSRRAAPAKTFGFRSLMNWQPIVIGTICAAFLLLALIGTAVYQLRRRQIKRREKELADEFDTVYNLQKRSPGSSAVGNSNVDGDRKLAHSAQMYHYQHQKQQMLAIEKASDHAHSSDEGSGSDHEEGNFTVYECPGLAQPGKHEVDNPLYVGESAEQGLGSGELTHPSDAEEGSDSTPTGAKSTDQTEQ